MRSLLMAIFFLSSSAIAEVPPDCNGWLYRSKKHEVAVFSEPDRSSKVMAQLKRGEKVCYIGEKDKFAIIQVQKDEESLAYVRLVDLWPGPLSKTAKKGVGKGQVDPSDYGIVGVFKRAKRYFHYMRSGGVPEDVLDAYEPITGIPGAFGGCESSCGESNENTGKEGE